MFLAPPAPPGPPMVRSGLFEFDEAHADDEFQVLCCPSCGQNNLHHLGVDVFSRGEDAALVTRTAVNAGGVDRSVVSNDASGNPSLCRDGMAIFFTCEHCTAYPIQLTIAQHKGLTYLSWRFGPEKPREDGEDDDWSNEEVGDPMSDWFPARQSP